MVMCECCEISWLGVLIFVLVITAEMLILAMFGHEIIWYGSYVFYGPYLAMKWVYNKLRGKHDT